MGQIIIATRVWNGEAGTGEAHHWFALDIIHEMKNTTRMRQKGSDVHIRITYQWLGLNLTLEASSPFFASPLQGHLPSVRCHQWSPIMLADQPVDYHQEPLPVTIHNH